MTAYYDKVMFTNGFRIKMVKILEDLFKCNEIYV